MMVILKKLFGVIMECSIYEFLSGLEEDLVNFYKQLNLSVRLPESNALIKNMILQSTAHGNHISEVETKHKKPVFKKDFFMQIHNNIKYSLFKEIHETKDKIVIIEKIAKSEELIGKLYKVVADYYKDLSEYYSKISLEIMGFSEEENMHRDMVLNEESKYL